VGEVGTGKEKAVVKLLGYAAQCSKCCPFKVIFNNVKTTYKEAKMLGQSRTIQPVS